MGPREAIMHGIKKPLIFKGRAIRSEFWWFAPIGILPTIIACWNIGWGKFEIYGGWWMLLLIFVPITFLAAGSRRLQDMGEEGHQILYPFLPVIMLWIAFQALSWFSLITLLLGIAFIMGILALLVLVPAYLFALLTRLMSICPIIGMLIVPSEPGTNRFGPNPNEVPS